ncbi:MAG: hypothetical protein B6U75_01125 [Desulfurococcales archaeon ex4484_217_1]|nr:MAG: hypothetical protein B6U75_01125 [Desulfurococcales archaeon ex4484_217_1]
MHMVRNQELVEEVIDTLRSRGFKVGFVEYPTYERRSLDVVARRSNEKFVMKVSFEIDNVGSKELSELAALSRIFDAAGIIVSKKTRKKELKDYVVYERYKVPAMTPETLREFIDSGEVYVYAGRGGYYVRVNGEKLRRKREERDMSLGDLAQLLGVSRKAVYEYERRSMSLSFTTALRLIEIFGEDIVIPINIRRVSVEEGKTLETQRLRTKFRKAVLKLKKLGFLTVVTERTPIDIAARRNDKGKLAITLKELNISQKDLKAKIEAAETVSKTLNIKSLIIDDLKNLMKYLLDFYS